MNQTENTATIRCMINREIIETASNPGFTALDFIRGHLGITGTKEGCREGECGACTVLIGEQGQDTMNYKAVASCMLPMGELDGKHIVTVEGLNSENLTPVQQVLVDEGGTQCGFCTPGFVMSLTGFFLTSPALSVEDAVDSIDGNICRCTGYVSIRRAIESLCSTFAPKFDKNRDRVDQLVEWGVLPGYFTGAGEQLLNPDYGKEETIPGGNGNGGKKDKGKRIVAGGTDLYIQVPGELEEDELEFVSRNPKLNGIRGDQHWIYLGAGVTVEEMKRSPLVQELYPGMPGYLKLVSSTIMRNRATIGGNIVNASPIGDLSIILLALNADLSLTKGNTTRQLPLRDFFKGYKKLDLKKGEIIETIEIPICPWVGDLYFHFEKVSQRRHLDIASCNSAIYIRMFEDLIDDIHISAGGVAPIPLYLEKTGESLKGKAINGENILHAVSAMESEIAPISDVRGSAGYKKRLLRNLLFSHFITLFPDKKLDEFFLETGKKG